MEILRQNLLRVEVAFGCTADWVCVETPWKVMLRVVEAALAEEVDAGEDLPGDEADEVGSNDQHDSAVKGKGGKEQGQGGNVVKSLPESNSEDFERLANDSLPSRDRLELGT